MIINVFKKDILKILTMFSISPGSRFSRNEIKEKTKLNNVNLDNSLTILINSKIIKKEKRLLSLNIENNQQIVKQIYADYKNLKKLPLEVYYSIIDLIFFLNKIKEIEVYLFGSYAKLIFKEDSDIDIAVISNKINSKKEISAIIEKIQKKYRKNIEVHYFKKEFYKHKKDPLVRDIIKNGVKLI